MDNSDTLPPAAPLPPPAFRIEGDRAILFSALAKAQGQFPEINKNCTAEVKGTTEKGQSYSYTFRYADLDSIVSGTRPGLSANGFALIFPLYADGDGWTQSVQLLHSSGGSIIAEGWFRDDAKPQVVGGRSTYMTRYLTRGLLGVTTEEDDDANAASGNEAKITRAPTKSQIQQMKTHRDPPAEKNRLPPPPEARGPEAENARATAAPVDISEDPPISEEQHEALRDLCRRKGLKNQAALAYGRDILGDTFPECLQMSGGAKLCTKLMDAMRELAEVA